MTTKPKVNAVAETLPHPQFNRGKWDWKEVRRVGLTAAAVLATIAGLTELLVWASPAETGSAEGTVFLIWFFVVAAIVLAFHSIMSGMPLEKPAFLQVVENYHFAKTGKTLD